VGVDGKGEQSHEKNKKYCSAAIRFDPAGLIGKAGVDAAELRRGLALDVRGNPPAWAQPGLQKNFQLLHPSDTLPDWSRKKSVTWLASITLASPLLFATS
jgi:hypothetical protein